MAAIPNSNGAEPVIRAAGLTKIFKDFWGRPKARAVDNVDFEVRRGEVFGLLGPNGSGKSTTIKLVLGLLYPTKGRVTVLGQSPRDVRTKARIGYLPEESYLYRYLTPGETLMFFGRLFSLDQRECRRRADQLIEMVGLGQARTRSVGEFSKGMQRRLGLAQALMNDPDLVILDEPTSGLDPIGCREIKDLIVELARKGKTVVLSSHLLADVEDVSDRVVIYYGGRIRAEGPLKELLASPDQLQINTPVVPRDALERALDCLRAATPGEVTVAAPTRNLERFFLGVVERARAEAATSGATSGHAIAEFIGAGAVAGAPRGAALLDRLAAKAAPVETVAAPAAAPVDQERLDALAKPAAPEVAPAPAAAAAPTPETMQKADEKLAGLLGRKP